MLVCARDSCPSKASLLLLLVAGCASFEPRPMTEVPFLERAQMQADDSLSVTVAVPSPGENDQIFGVDVAKEGIQPVWLRIENRGDHEYFMLPASIDPNYFSPYEAAWKSHLFLGGDTNREINRLFVEQAILPYVAPNSTQEGFVYTNMNYGIKYVQVELVSAAEGEVRVFNFLTEVPGIEADYEQVDFDKLYPPSEIRDVDDEGLRTYLESLPCCVLGGDNETPGDPMNIVVIGPSEATFQPFVARGWDVTETITGGTAFATVWSSVFGSRYRTSPVSPLYVFDRPQDLALQKARATVDERNHLRLWLAPVRYQGMDVWVGQISRDIGVRFSGKTFVTHKIDPEVDEARYYLVQDLFKSGSLAKLGHVKGVGPAPRDQPRDNYTGDWYYTDGLRVVLVISPKYVPSAEVDLFPIPPWDDPVKYLGM